MVKPEELMYSERFVNGVKRVDVHYPVELKISFRKRVLTVLSDLARGVAYARTR